MNEVEANAIAPDPAPSAPRPWGPWVTTFFCIVIAIAYAATQFLVMGAFVAWQMISDNDFDPNAFAKTADTNGDILAVATVAAVPIVVGMCVFFAWLRRGISLRDYFNVRTVSPATAALWVIAIFSFAVVMDLVTYTLGRPIVPEFMTETMESSTSILFLAFALVVCAPLTEEVLFRGFLFKGLEHSRLGGVGAIIISAIVWAVIHLQYDWYGVVTILIAGVFMGTARYKTQSVPLCIGMHSLINVVATVEAYMHVQWAAGS